VPLRAAEEPQAGNPAEEADKQALSGEKVFYHMLGY